MKYLHQDAEGVYHLDHRLTPEVSAMLCAMSSRMPAGGIAARYSEIVEAVAKGLREEDDGLAETMGLVVGDEETQQRQWMRAAENRICEYPIPKRAEGFFTQFVERYGHSSIMELTGQPAVYTEGISWYTAYLLFDSPICSGQEFSTRAVRHKDWPMARECYTGERKPTSVDLGSSGVAEFHLDQPHPVLKALHDDWFEVFEAEVDWWREFFSDADNRAAFGIKDKEPFRPALDRARWAIPGTIATGCAHTGNLRERARALRDGLMLAQASNDGASIQVWQDIRQGYANALPGLSGMGLREAVYDSSTKLAGHLRLRNTVLGPDVSLDVVFAPGRFNIDHVQPFERGSDERSYVDPIWNTYAQVEITFECSLAVSRDWHRHRTMYPWVMRLVRDDPSPDNESWGSLVLDTHYEPKSDLAKAKVPELLRRSAEAHDAFMAEGNQMKAMLALPLGSRVEMRGSGGLRDAIYMLELRRDAHGANFEYQEQATTAANYLRERLERHAAETDFPLQNYLGV